MRTIGPSLQLIVSNWELVERICGCPTISLVHLRDSESVLAIFYDVIMGFIVAGDGGELWAGEFGERVQVQAVESKSEKIQQHCRSDGLPDRNGTEHLHGNGT